MKKNKIPQLIFTGLLLLNVTSNTIVKASEVVNYNISNEVITNFVYNYKFQYIDKLSDVEKNKFKNILIKSFESEKYKNVDKYVVSEAFDKLIGRKFGMIIFEDRASIWDGQGMTTDELAIIIDLALVSFVGWITVGTGAEAIAAIVERFSEYKVVEVIKTALVNVGLASFANKLNGWSSWIVGLLDPGHGIADWFDSIDFYPNNGRINLWE